MPAGTDPRPAPNPILYQFENLFEAALVTSTATLLTANTLTAQLLKQRDTTKQVTPRVEWQLIVGQQEQRDYIVPNTGNAGNNYQDAWKYQNLWNGTLRAAIVTNRIKDSGTQYHKTIRGLIRWMIDDYIAQVNINLQYHSIFRIFESGSQPTIEANNDEDVSKMAFTLMFSIKNSAWPVPS